MKLQLPFVDYIAVLLKIAHKEPKNNERSWLSTTHEQLQYHYNIYVLLFL